MRQGKKAMLDMDEDRFASVERICGTVIDMLVANQV